MKKSYPDLRYTTLLKERGTKGALYALIIVAVFFLINRYVFITPLQGYWRYLLVAAFFFYAGYYTWKPRWSTKANKDRQ